MLLVALFGCAKTRWAGLAGLDAAPTVVPSVPTAGTRVARPEMPSPLASRPQRTGLRSYPVSPAGLAHPNRASAIYDHGPYQEQIAYLSKENGGSGSVVFRI